MERSHVFGKFIDKVNERDLSTRIEMGFVYFNFRVSFYFFAYILIKFTLYLQYMPFLWSFFFIYYSNKFYRIFLRNWPV